MDNWLNDLKKLDIGKLEFDVSLKKYNTFKLGGNARCIAYPKNVSSLVKLIEYIKDNHIKYKILGKGSNLIFNDKLYDGILIKLDFFDNLKIDGDKIKAGSGISLIKLSYVALENSLSGLEFAGGIPGTLGGGVFMNAGAHGSEMKNIVESIKVLTPDLKIIDLKNKDLAFDYRTSFLKENPNYICLEATISLKRKDKNIIKNVMESFLEIRKKNQPLEYPSAGSVFRNTDIGPAGKLIEDAGLKESRKGDAMVSSKHANFIINIGNATGEDVRNLISFVQEKVKEKYHIDLKYEQEFVNFE